MLVENGIASRPSGLSEPKQALLQKRLRTAMESAAHRQTIPRRGQRGKAPLSYEQERLWFLDQLEPNSPLYSLPLALRLRGPLDRAALEKSLAAIVAAHEVLRTRFIAENGEPVQVADEPAPLEMPVIDLSERREPEKELRGRLSAEASRPFNLSSDLMVRSM